MNINNLETLSRKNLYKFRTNLDAIIEKYSLPFDEYYHDVIDLETLTICADRGQLRSKSYKSKKFGKTKLAVEHCLDLTTYIEDSAIGSSQLSTTLYELNTPESKLHDSLTQPFGLSVNHNSSFQNDVLCELGNEEPEPSDAETLSDSDSDSWESDDDVPDKGESSISKEASDDAESIPEEVLVTGKSESFNVDLSISSADVPSARMINLCAREFSKLPELYSSAVILTHENEEYLKDCAHSGYSSRFKVIAELNTSPEILTEQSDLPKSGFVFENFIHLMQDHTKRKQFKAQSPRTIASNDKIIGQDNEIQAHDDSTGVKGPETELGLKFFFEKLRQNQNAPVDVSSVRIDHSVSSISVGLGSALSREELSDLNDVETSCNKQYHASSELHPGLCRSPANSRKLLDETFTVMPIIDADSKGVCKHKHPVLMNDFSRNNNLIWRRCCRSDSLKSGYLTSNLSCGSKSSISVSETTSEMCSKSCLNRSGSNDVVTKAVASSQGGKILLTSFASQSNDQSLMISPNRFRVLSSSDKPAVTLCDFIPCSSNTSPVNSLSSIETTCSTRSLCVADSLQMPNSTKRLQEMFEQMKSVVPKVIPESVLPSVISELPPDADGRTGSDFKHPLPCSRISSAVESVDLNDTTVTSGIDEPVVLMNEKRISFKGIGNLPSSCLLKSSTERSSLDCASQSDFCEMAQRNFDTVNHAFTKLSRKTIDTSVFLKTLTQQNENAFLDSWRQKAQTDSNIVTLSPSECLAKINLSSPKVSVMCVENLQHSAEEPRGERFLLAGKVAEINNNDIQCNTRSASVSYGQSHGILRNDVEELCEKVECANAMKEMKQWAESSSCADQKFWLKKQWLNKTEASQGGRDGNVSVQSLNHIESRVQIETELSSAENLSDFTSDSDEECCFVSLLSDLEEGEAEYGESNVVKQEVAHEDTESVDAPVVTLAGVTSTPTKDGSSFVFDISFLSSISDSSEIERIKELAMEVVFEEELEETLIETTKIKSSVTAEPSKKTNGTPVTRVQLTEEDDESGGLFEFLSSSDEFQGIVSLAKFREVAQKNKIMAKTGLETTSMEKILKFSENQTVDNKIMRTTDEEVLKTDNVTTRNGGEMSNHRTQILHKGLLFPIKEILEINDNDVNITNGKMIKTTLEMKKTKDNVTVVGKTEDRIKKECFGSTMPVSFYDTIQTRNRSRKTCVSCPTVTPASASVCSKAEVWMKLSGIPSSVSAASSVGATYVKANQHAIGDSVRCSPLIPVCPLSTEVVGSGVLHQPSSSCLISAPAKLWCSFDPEKRQSKSSKDKTNSDLQKAASSKLDMTSVVSLSPQRRLPRYLPRPGRDKVEPNTLQKTPKRSSDHSCIEQNHSTKRCRLSLAESSDNDQMIFHNAADPYEERKEMRHVKSKIALNTLPYTLKPRKRKDASIVS